MILGVIGIAAVLFIRPNADIERDGLSEEEALIFSDLVSNRRSEINALSSLAEQEWTL